MECGGFSSGNNALSPFHFTRTKMKQEEEMRTGKKCASSYHLLSRHLDQIGNEQSESPCWHVVDHLHDYGEVAEDVGEGKVPIS